MDGITEYTFRNVFNRHFPEIDKYYAPFIQPNDKPLIVPKEEIEIIPENNEGINLVPQVLTCDADGFIRIGRRLEEYGYGEINLNAGCPSKVIVSKGKGSGMLADTYKLDRFLDAVFTHDWKADISIKTRLGMDETDDFYEILEVYKKYPISELIIHPRYRSDFYNGIPRYEFFELVSEFDEFTDGRIKVCYNGNIFSKEDADEISVRYPYISNIMLGRGLLANPALVREIKGGDRLNRTEFIAYHNDLYAEFGKVVKNERILLFKMKELWQYWRNIVDVSEGILDMIKTANDIAEYKHRVGILFEQFQIKTELTD